MLPREKALNYGINSLNNEELLALIIKSGYKNTNVFQIVDNLLNEANGFSNILGLTYEELVNIKGINKAKALEILAILEISKRLSKIDFVREDKINNTKKLIDWIRFNIGFKDHEEFFAIFLSNSGAVIKSEVLFRGSKNQSIVAIDEVLRKAILLKAGAIIVCHNHPSGNVEPSSADISITNSLNKACLLMSIPLIDHIIVAHNNYYSFKQNGLL